MVNENPSESQESSNKVNKENTLNNCARDVTKDLLIWSDKDKNLKAIMEEATVSPDLKYKIKAFLERNKKDYETINIEDITIEKLRTWAVRPYLELKSQKEAFKENIFNEFKLDKKDRKKTEKEIEELTWEEISRLDTDKKREKFLETLLKRKPEALDVLKTINDLKIIPFYSTLNKEQKEVIRCFFDERGNYVKITPDVILDLFTEFWSNYLSFEQRKELVSVFMPNISLYDAKMLGFKTEDEVLAIKRDIVIKSKLVKTEYIESVVSSLKDEEINISTKDLITTSEQANRLVETLGLQKFTNSWNEMVDWSSGEAREKSGISFDLFKTKLKQTNKVEGLEENFKKDSFIVLDVEEEYDNSDESYTRKGKKQPFQVFFKINDLWESKWALDITLCWEKYISLKSKQTASFWYNRFLETVNNWIRFNSKSELLDIKKVSFLTKEEIDNKIKSWVYQENTLDSSELERKREEKKGALEEQKANLKKELVSELEAKNPDLKRLKDEIFSLNLELTSKNSELAIELDESKKKYIEKEILKLKEQISQKEAERDFIIEEELWDYKEYSELTKSLEQEQIYDFNKLKEDLNENDKEWEAFWISELTTFKTDDQIYTIVNNPEKDGNVVVNSPAWKEPSISFETFFETFKQKKCKRTSNTKNVGDMITNLWQNTDTSSAWWDLEFKDGKIVKKDKEDSLDYNLLLSKEDDDMIQIHSISWDKAEISLWEYDDYKKDKDWNFERTRGWGKILSYSYKVDSDKKTVDISWLESWVKIRKAWVRSIEQEKQDNIESVKLKWSFWSRVFSRMSIADILAWWKLGLESIENYLKEGNSEQAAKFAQWFFGKFLPEELKSDLSSRVEWATKKRMDDYVKKLSDIDSGPATKLIASWLENRDCPQYKKEAGLIYMLEKYWVLYAKWGLKKEIWTFLWYEALWWKIWDTLYKEIEQEAIDNNIPFAEEELVYRLLVKQCTGGYNNIKRRSRFHKEVKALRAKWKNEEREKWKTDWGDIRQIAWRVKFTMWELEWWNYPNAVWWLETVVGKWWKMDEMNKVPFVMLFSWVAYGFEQKTIDDLKNFPVQWKMLPLLRFISETSDIDLVNQTIVALSKRIWEIRGDGSKMYNEAKEIFENQKSSSKTYPEKIKATEIFYEKHWKILTESLYTLNMQKADEESWISKIIRLEKDEHLDDNGNKVSGNPIFKKYYDRLQAFSSQFSFWDDELFSDAFYRNWTSGISTHKTTKELLVQNQGWGYIKPKSWPIMWDEISWEIEAIVKRNYWTKDTIEEVKRKRKEDDLKHLLRWFISWLLEAHGTSRWWTLETIISGKTSVMASKFRAWWLDFTRILDYSYQEVIDWGADTLISRYVNTLINRSSWSGFVSDIDKTTFLTKEAASDAFND